MKTLFQSPKHTLCVLLIFMLTTSQAQIFVKADAVGANNGSSWVDAYTSLQMAIDSNVINNEIWIAAGTYKPSSDTTGNYTPSDGRTLTIHPKLTGTNRNLKLYGGFEGSETFITQRNPTQNICIISGDLGIPVNTNDNSYHVFTLTNNTISPNIIDGFTISDGNANGLGFGEDKGGACYTIATRVNWTNCFVVDNNAVAEGGAFYIETSLADINTCTLSNNHANKGGAVYTGYSTVGLTKSNFTNNSAANEGGAIYQTDHLAAESGGYYSKDVKQNHFLSNQAGTSGGAIYINDGKTFTYYLSNVFKNNDAPDGAALTVINSLYVVINFTTFVDNGNNSGLLIESSTGEVDHCILWNNGPTELLINNSPAFIFQNTMVKNAFVVPNVGYNVFQSIDPKFVNYPSDLHLLASSPAINIGSYVAGNYFIHDIDGTSRIKGPLYDMGAYEFDPSSCEVTNRVYIDFSASGSKNATSWADAVNDLEDGFYIAGSCPTVNEVWIAHGLYKPDINSHREHTLKVEKSLLIAGGFIGFENTLAERILNPTFPTIISGDIGIPNNLTDNSKRLFGLSKPNMQVIFDGLTIEHAYNTDLSGAAIVIFQGSIEINHCIIQNNLGLQGAALYSSANTRIKNSQFLNNNATNSGGALAMFYDTLLMENVLFQGNTASIFGGAIYGISTPYFYADSLSLIENTSNKGGAMHLNNCHIHLDKLYSSMNSAQFGGSLHASFGSLSLKNAVMSHDSALVGGSLYLNDLNATLDSISCDQNKGLSGVFLNAVYADVNIDHTFINNASTIVESTADLIHLQDSDLSMSNFTGQNCVGVGLIDKQDSNISLYSCNFNNNQGVNQGGRMIGSYGTGNDVLNKVQFIGNQYQVFYYGNSNLNANTSLIIEKSKFRNNRASVLDVFNYEDCIIQNTLFENTEIGSQYYDRLFRTSNTNQVKYHNVVVYGSVNLFSYQSRLIECYSGTLDIGNAIFYNNTNFNFLNSTATNSIYNNIVQGGYPGGTFILDTDPKFVNPALGDYNLQMGSPAINTGSPLYTPITDILGNPRPQGGFFDMGIYEYSLPTHFVFQGGIDDDWYKSGNWDTGFPPPNVFNGQIMISADAVKMDGLGFDLKTPGTMNIGNGVEVTIK